VASSGSPTPPVPENPLVASSPVPAMPEAAENPSVAYVYFQGHINVGSTASLLAVMSHLETQGIPRVVLALTTGGGEIEAGMNLYDRLCALPFHLVTHAVETVQSMGMAIYLAGDERIVGPQATFMLHPSANRFQAGELVGVVALRQIISNLEASDAREASILEDRTSMSTDDAKAMVEATTVLNADQAVSVGVAHEIKLLEIEPANAPFFPLGPYPYPGE